MDPEELFVISLLEGRIILRRAEFYIGIKAIPRVDEIMTVVIPFQLYRKVKYL